MDQVATLLVQYKKERDDSVRVIHQIMSADVRCMHEQFHSHIQQSSSRLAQVEATNQSRGEANDGGVHKQDRGYHWRILDPKNWDLTTLKDGQLGFKAWRKTFELQVRAICVDLDKVLERTRERKPT